MVVKNITYRPNPYVKCLYKNNKHLLQNSMTGIAFNMSKASFAVYEFIDKRRRVNLKEITSNFPQFTQQNISEVIRFFHTKKLILSESLDDLTAFTKKDTTIFELNDMEKEGNLCLIGVPSGQGNPLPNSCRGFPDNFRIYLKEKRMSLKEKTINCNEIVNAYFGIKQNYLFSEVAFEYARDIGNMFLDIQHESKELILKKIQLLASEVFKKNTPFFLGGDHSITYGTLKAATELYKNLYVIQFDAHTDTYQSRYTQLKHPEIYPNHGNFMCKCLDWDAIKMVHQLGIRGEVNYGFKPYSNKQKVISCIELKELLNKKEFTLDIPKGFPIYISIDIDVLDPVFAPATATPVSNGLSIDELLKCLQIIFDQYHNQLIGFDLVEISPHLCTSSKTTMSSATNIVLQIIQRFSYYEQFK